MAINSFFYYKIFIFALKNLNDYIRFNFFYSQILCVINFFLNYHRFYKKI